ncbi:NET1-associated nuclear protein 1 [Coemansia sp. RSA 1813]|nr:NET1-associated nuclear protein 1 [Coemansia sp. RSA 1646]KAJ1770690.1 NET1-associated nuclear protein 1 [Coemansia sp. RSA 1843]KAJ2087340.1 NET1-associated nuclear protein 1 [Coemansia sp. RSA 986]KAJ2215695.1 NET1-associated nuclear protein 1 [Coemansia sp. RSA 487]KAJ2568441.1 NET1-associated nuclear protein 1 [Coemansia sp. RSA 1813]
MAGKKIAKVASPEKHTNDKKKKRNNRPAQLDLEKLASQSVSVSSHSHGSNDATQTPIVEATISTQNTDLYRAVELKLVSGGALTNDPIVFSADSSLFYLAKDNAVAVYNVQNAEMVQNFTLQQQHQHRQGMSALVSGKTKPTAIHALVGDPDQSHQGHRVYTFSADHRARLWDADTGELIHTWDLGCTVEHAVADPTAPNVFYCAVRRSSGAKTTEQSRDRCKYTIDRIVLSREDARATMDVQQPLMRAAGVLGLTVRSDGRWIAAYSKFRVYLVHLRGSGKPVRHRWRMVERISAVSFRPGEPVLAVGDWRGRIVFWFCLDDDIDKDTEDRHIVRQPHHWHAHRVNAVTFTEDGATMLSGGEEGVLVFWRLETDLRDYLPRLGSDILGIAVSPDQMYYAVTLRDNTISVFSAMNRSLVSSLQGLKFAERTTTKKALDMPQDSGEAMQSDHMRRMARLLDNDPFTTGIVVHPSTRSLVLNGEPGHLQVFNHAADRHLASIEVASFNRISGTTSAEAVARVSQPHVDLVRYSTDGTWMATVDSRKNETRAATAAGATSVCYLKFWKLDPATQSYRLVSRIDNPHTHGVRDIAFQPVVRRPGTSDSEPSMGLLCVSTGCDHAFRVWEHRTVSSHHNGTSLSVWSCRSTAQYRGMQPHGAAFSADGSTLAVTFGSTVTLWDAAAGSQGPSAPVGTLVASALVPPLTGVSFVGASHYLCTWSGERLDMWNMLTGSIWWTQVMSIQDVFVHQRAALVAVAAYQIPQSSTASVMVYAPRSPNPLLALQHPGGIEAVALVPSSSSKSSSGRSRPHTEHGQLKPDPLDSNALVVLTPQGLINVYSAESEFSAFARATQALRTSVDPTDVESSARPMESAVFSSIFGNTPSIAPQNQKALAPNAHTQHVRSALRLVRSAVQSSYVNAPHHVLPPVSSLFTQFVSSQLLPATTTTNDALAKNDTAGSNVAATNNGADSDIEMLDDDGAEPASRSNISDAVEFFATMSHEFRKTKA